MAGNFQQRELSGAVFKNDRKTADNHPDYKGNCLIDGKEYWISGWMKDGARGKFLSMAFQPKDGQGASTSGGLEYTQPRQSSGRPKPNFDDMDDDIPF